MHIAHPLGQIIEIMKFILSSGKPGNGRSVQSSPGNSYNKYLARSTSSNLGTSPGRALPGASSPVTAFHSPQSSSPGNKVNKNEGFYFHTSKSDMIKMCLFYLNLNVELERK